MMSWILRRKLDAFEREYDYDMSYARELLELGPSVLLRFQQATKLGEYREVPLPVWFAASILSVRAGDCGPCTQLVVDMATRAGVPEQQLSALLNGQFESLPADVRLVAEFTRSVIERRSDPQLREQVIARFGRKGLTSIAFAIVAASLYPTLKYALGHGEACSVIRLGDKNLRPAPVGAHAA